MSLFQAKRFISHSGIPMKWKIECDALTPEDWDGLALIAQDYIPRYGSVDGVPNGGVMFAEALSQYTNPDSERLLIVDDVLTTGRSLREHKGGREAIGLVVFARGICPYWVTALFQMPRGKKDS